MAGLFDSLGHMFGGAAVPGSMTQKMAMMGSPLIQALMAKHGVSVPEAGADVGPDAAPPQVGPDLSNAGANAGNVVAALGAGGSPFDSLDTGVNPGALGGDAMGGIKDALSANAAHPRGFLDRIGDFIHSDEGRAALLRSGAATLQGGLGAGIQAGANFVDQRRHEREEGAASERKFGLQERELDDTNAYRTGQLDLQREQNRETAEHYRRGDMNEYRRIGADLHKHDTPSGDARLQSQTNIYTHLNPSGDTVTNNRERRFEHLTPSGDTTTTQAAETARNTQDNQTAITTANINHQPPPDSTTLEYPATDPKKHWFGPDEPGQPKRTVVSKTPVRPSEVKPADTGAKQISTDAEYNALPSGSRFTGPDGQVRIKP